MVALSVVSAGGGGGLGVTTRRSLPGNYGVLLLNCSESITR